MKEVTVWIDVPDPCDPALKPCVTSFPPSHVIGEGWRRFKATIRLPVRSTEDGEEVRAFDVKEEA